jgi:tetratricopeptide (TPR) repeat protein
MAFEALGRIDEARTLAMVNLATLDAGPIALPASTDMRGFYRIYLAHGGARMTPVGKAYYLAQIGDFEQALDLIEAAIDHHDPESLWVPFVPLSKPLRHLSRYRDLVARLPSATARSTG